jgi:diguanylate cyclase (GGDEF)-like protein
VKFARRAVSGWPLWDLPRWLQVLVAGVIALYLGAVAVAVAFVHVEARQLWLFALLLACGAVSVELTRRAGQTGGVVRDVYAIWDLPVALLLPPAYVLLVPIPRMILTQARIRKTPLVRRAYSAAALGLAYAAASVVFHHTVSLLGTGMGTGVWTLLVVACGLLRLALNDGLVLTAVKGAAPQTRLRSEITGSEAVFGSSAELALGTLVTFVAAHVALAAVLALPLVISLQRSLRHSQLLAEASVDAKTGLLNDRTWRRRAAEEVERAVQAGLPMAVGILDIDHFKAVNDTYGHPAGDQVLESLAAVVTAQLRGAAALIGRTGGEEFAFVLPGLTPRAAIEAAERLRKTIPLTVFRFDGTSGQGLVCVTVSIGMIVTAHPDRNLGRYYGSADRALYAAKQSGRDAVWVVRADRSDPEPQPSPALRDHDRPSLRLVARPDDRRASLGFTAGRSVPADPYRPRPAAPCGPAMRCWSHCVPWRARDRRPRSGWDPTRLLRCQATAVANEAREG